MSPDFNRNVHCLLGLPFDAINMESARRNIQAAAANNSPCFLSTPNLNFLVAAQSDNAFRSSVINSDLSVADGMPIVWIARLLGIPIFERVAGSALFDELRSSSGKQLSVFFFGGPDGAAERACTQLNLERKGLVCVGFESPGFGSIEEMSTDAIIRRINASNADFLVVSLGARKGQAWIERNKSRITIPVYSHLGAVVNFVAGTVKRAPVWMQKIGLEWMWRVKEDPALWRRYASDGFALISLLVSRVIPNAWYIFLHKPSLRDRGATIEITDDGDEVKISLGGAWVHENLGPLRECLANHSLVERGIRLDFENVTYVDSALIGLLLLLHGDRIRQGKRMQFDNLNKSVLRSFRYACAEYVLAPC